MLRLIGLALSIGIADSVNPTTIAPALYLASGERSRRRVFEFTVAVFAVYFLGGVLIALGPGHLLLSLLPNPRRHLRWIIETAVGLAMIGVAIYLLRNRHTLAGKELPAPDAEGKSSALLGATITIVELPTAFPYFAVIAATIGSGLHPLRQVVILLIFSLAFVMPQIGIVLVLTVAPRNANRVLTGARNWLQAHWPQALAVLLLIAGVFIVTLGITGLTVRRSRFGRFVHKIPRILH